MAAGLSRTEAMLLARLDETVTKHPELAQLRALIPPDLELTSEFAEAYLSDATRGTLKSLLLRVLLADPSMVPREAAKVTGPVLARIVVWLRQLQVLDGVGYSRDPMPKSLFGLFNEPRATVDVFTRRVALEPWWSMRCGKGPGHPALRHLSSDELAPLEHIVGKRTMSTADAESMAADEGDRSPPRTRWFFDTGVGPLDLRSSLVYLSAVLDDRDGGRAQNRLPQALTSRWRLSRLSIPSVLVFADIATMAALGCLDLHMVSDDWLGLRQAFAGPADTVLRDGDADVRAALKKHLARGIITAEGAAKRRALLDEQRLDGVFDSGLLFNARRLLSLESFEAFAPDYACINAARLLEVAVDGWSPGMVAPWAVALRDSTGTALELRDLGNIRAYLEALGVDLSNRAEVWKALPSVGRYALGATEFKAAGSRRATTPSKSGAAHARVGALPRLEDLARLGGGTAYILSPGYSGALPDGGQVFVHAAHAAGFSLPSGVLVIGEAPIAWGEDALQRAEELLLAMGWAHVHRLS